MTGLSLTAPLFFIVADNQCALGRSRIGIAVLMLVSLLIIPWEVW